MLDVLFVNPPSPDKHVYIRDINRSGRRSRERTIWPQTSLAYLAAVIQKAGYKVEIIDCIAEEMSWDTFKELLKNKSPRYVVTNVITSIITNDLYTAYLAKSLGARSIAIGPHITYLAKETMQRYPTLDIGIIGEAEETIVELIKKCDSSGDLNTVKGIVFRDKDTIIVTQERPFIKDLDELPFPLHELLPIPKYSLPFIGKGYTFVLSSRGCPYFCTFCRQPIMWKRQVRSRSAKSIFEELKYIKRLGITNFMFHSDTFTVDRNLVIELCKLMSEAGLNLRWCCNSRVDTIDQELLAYMKKAGCWMIMYGIETSSDLILENVKKGGKASFEITKKAVMMAKRAGIKVWGYFIMGLPGETKETIKNSINFAKQLPLDLVNFAVGAPYPGTEFYQEAKQRGWLETEEWESFDQNYSAIVSYPDLPSEEILKSIRKAYIRWYFTPRGLLVILKGCTNFNYIKNILKIGWQHLMISKK